MPIKKITFDFEIFFRFHILKIVYPILMKIWSILAEIWSLIIDNLIIVSMQLKI